MMNEKKPVSHSELSCTGDPPRNAMQEIERIHASIETTKGELVLDPKFLENITRKVISDPGSFVREVKGEVSAAEMKEKRHTLQGKTNKMKMIIFLSDVEAEQLKSLVSQRGDRSPSDLINQVVCTILGAMRSI